MTLDEKLLSNIIEIQKSQMLDFELYLGNSTFTLSNVILSKSSTPVNRPTNRGGVFFSNKLAYKIKAIVNDLSIVPFLSKSMLGPNPEFEELMINTKLRIGNSLKKVTLFTYLTNSMQSSSNIELNMTIVGINTD